MIYCALPLAVSFPSYPSDALDYIARRLISTQAVRDSKDRYVAPERLGLPCMGLHCAWPGAMYAV